MSAPAAMNRLTMSTWPSRAAAKMAGTPDCRTACERGVRPPVYGGFAPQTPQRFAGPSHNKRTSMQPCVLGARETEASRARRRT